MDQLSPTELKEFLDLKADQYNTRSFIEEDPISIPHRFQQKEDIEIAGFLASIIAWGNRKMIIRNANKLMNLMDEAPFDFVCNASETELERVTQFVHRTLNGTDALFLMHALRRIYTVHGGMEAVFAHGFESTQSIFGALAHFRTVCFETPHENRSEKHISSVMKGSSAKRLNMYLRWMVRNDSRGVDFGLWETIPMHALHLPLDVHTGNVSRKLGILKRTQSDWKAVEEVTTQLRQLDLNDPIKYDFALFGLGVYEKF